MSLHTPMLQTTAALFVVTFALLPATAQETDRSSPEAVMRAYIAAYNQADEAGIRDLIHESERRLLGGFPAAENAVRVQTIVRERQEEGWAVLRVRLVGEDYPTGADTYMFFLQTDDLWFLTFGYSPDFVPPDWIVEQVETWEREVLPPDAAAWDGSAPLEELVIPAGRPHTIALTVPEAGVYALHAAGDAGTSFSVHVQDNARSGNLVVCALEAGTTTRIDVSHPSAREERCVLALVEVAEALPAAATHPLGRSKAYTFGRLAPTVLGLDISTPGLHTFATVLVDSERKLVSYLVTPDGSLLALGREHELEAGRHALIFGAPDAAVEAKLRVTPVSRLVAGQALPVRAERSTVQRVEIELEEPRVITIRPGAPGLVLDLERRHGLETDRIASSEGALTTTLAAGTYTLTVSLAASGPSAVETELRLTTSTPEALSIPRGAVVARLDGSGGELQLDDGETGAVYFELERGAAVVIEGQKRSTVRSGTPSFELFRDGYSRGELSVAGTGYWMARWLEPGVYKIEARASWGPCEVTASIRSAPFIEPGEAVRLSMQKGEHAAYFFTLDSRTHVQTSLSESGSGLLKLLDERDRLHGWELFATSATGELEPGVYRLEVAATGQLRSLLHLEAEGASGPARDELDPALLGTYHFGRYEYRELTETFSLELSAATRPDAIYHAVRRYRVTDRFSPLLQYEGEEDLHLAADFSVVARTDRTEHTRTELERDGGTWRERTIDPDADSTSTYAYDGPIYTHASVLLTAMSLPLDGSIEELTLEGKREAGGARREVNVEIGPWTEIEARGETFRVRIVVFAGLYDAPLHVAVAGDHHIVSYWFEGSSARTYAGTAEEAANDLPELHLLANPVQAVATLLLTFAKVVPLDGLDEVMDWRALYKNMIEDAQPSRQLSSEEVTEGAASVRSTWRASIAELEITAEELERRLDSLAEELSPTGTERVVFLDDKPFATLRWDGERWLIVRFEQR